MARLCCTRFCRLGSLYDTALARNFLKFIFRAKLDLNFPSYVSRLCGHRCVWGGGCPPAVQWYGFRRCSHRYTAWYGSRRCDHMWGGRGLSTCCAVYDLWHPPPLQLGGVCFLPWRYFEAPPHVITSMHALTIVVPGGEGGVHLLCSGTVLDVVTRWRGGGLPTCSV